MGRVRVMYKWVVVSMTHSFPISLSSLTHRPSSFSVSSLPMLFSLSPFLFFSDGRMVVAGRCERRRRRDKHPQAPFFCSHSIPSPLFSFFNPKTPKHKPMFLYLQIEKKEHRYYLSLGFCFDLGLMVMLGRWSKHGLVIFTMVFDASAVVCSGVDG
jgi:hypothetical protein